MLMGTGG